MQVLHVVDSSYHILNDMKNTSVPQKRKDEQKQENFIGFMERISVVIEHIGISVINIHPQVGESASSTKVPWSLIILWSSVVSCAGIAVCLCEDHHN